MRRIAVALVLLVTSVAAPVVAEGGAGAATAPRLTLELLKKRINVHESGYFVYHAHHLRPHSIVVLQRRVGTAAWAKFGHTPETQGNTTGTFRVGALDFPEHSQYRARVVHNGHVTLQTGVRNLYVYAKATLATVCTGVLDGHCSPGKRELADGSKFAYVMTTPIRAAADPWAAQLHSAKTSCRSITLRYVSDVQDATNTTRLELRQKGRAAQKHSNSAAKVGKFTAKLNSKKWGMSVAQDEAGTLMFFNGSASCWSKTGAA